MHGLAIDSHGPRACRSQQVQFLSGMSEIAALRPLGRGTPPLGIFCNVRRIDRPYFEPNQEKVMAKWAAMLGGVYLRRDILINEALDVQAASGALCLEFSIDCGFGYYNRADVIHR